MKIKEQQLNNYLYYFKNKNCIIQVSGDYQAKFELYRIKIWYDDKLGILHIKDYTRKDTFSINITDICYIDIDNNILHIQLDETKITLKTLCWRNKWRI